MVKSVLKLVAFELADLARLVMRNQIFADPNCLGLRFHRSGNKAKAGICRIAAIRIAGCQLL